jgi:hypothetical protein
MSQDQPTADPWAVRPTISPAVPGSPAPPMYPVAPVYQTHGGWLQTALAAAGLVTLCQVAEAAIAWPVLRQNLPMPIDSPDALGNPTSLTLVVASGLLALTSLLALVAAYVTTCLWLWRARSNAERLAPDLQTRSKGWVWGGWICPIVSFWFPFQIVRDVLLAGTPARTHRPVVGWLLAAFLIYLICLQVVTQTDPSTLPAIRVSVGFEFLSALAAVSAFNFWVVVVLRIRHDQDRTAREQGLIPYS